MSIAIEIDAETAASEIRATFRKFPAAKPLAARKAKRDVRVDPKAKLVIDDETGRMSLDFDDCDAASDLAEAYGLELDDTYVKLGHCDDMGLPIPYRHLVDQWIALADVWEADDYDRWKSEIRQDRQRGAW